MKMVADEIPGYCYGSSAVARSPVSLRELANLKGMVGFTAEDQRYLQLAGDVLFNQTKQVVDTWRQIIAERTHLAKQSRALDQGAVPEYSHNSGLRFQQWVLDTCRRSYDQDWLNYQHEIALRHACAKNNEVDKVATTAYIPIRDVIVFAAIVNDTLKPFLHANGDPVETVERMHRAWCKSVQLQIALWAQPYAAKTAANEW